MDLSRAIDRLSETAELEPVELQVITRHAPALAEAMLESLAEQLVAAGEPTDDRILGSSPTARSIVVARIIAAKRRGCTDRQACSLARVSGTLLTSWRAAADRGNKRMRLIVGLVEEAYTKWQLGHEQTIVNVARANGDARTILQLLALKDPDTYKARASARDVEPESDAPDIAVVVRSQRARLAEVIVNQS